MRISADSKWIGIIQKSASWTGFVGSLLTFLLGIIHVITIGAKIVLPEYGESFIYDSQKTSWREALFSLKPDVIFEVWTPFFIGLIGVISHFESNELKITENYKFYFAFNLFQHLFATIAYCGYLGLIFSLVVIVAVALCFVALLLDDGDASLHLKMNNTSKIFGLRN